MSWIVIGEENGRIKLVSKSISREQPGLLPKGSYLTVQDKDNQATFILRVDDSTQFEPYKPSPLVIDMDLSGLYADAKCQNIIHAYRVMNISNRDDGKIDFIPPQSIARRSTQEEINLAFGNNLIGPRIFLATIHGGKNQILIDENKKNISLMLPNDMFFHQTLICGKTGSGKTVAMKYLAQYFVEELEGAVLAINVKDIDFLCMDKPSHSDRAEIKKEWADLGVTPHGIKNCTIYYPANIKIENTKGITYGITKKVTLDVNRIDPDALTGLLQNISEVGAQNFPDIFRYWQANKQKSEKFTDFLNFFRKSQKSLMFQTLNIRGDESVIKLHSGTYENIQRNLNAACIFFDNENAETLEADDILSKGKLSIINVASKGGIQFGSILLRHLLRRIVEEKTNQLNSTPILIIIDEVHQFYNSSNSIEALGDLDTICRTGRSQQIGVIFASQNMNDIPRGLSNVVNTKIYFKSDGLAGNIANISNDEIQSLNQGFAAVNIHGVSQLRIVKFPISLAGVFN
jgi:uncharacterized protein